MPRRTIRWVVPLLVVGAVAVGAATAATGTHAQKGTVRTAKSATFGTILVAANGRTLYRFTVDRKGVNRCSSDATCNKYWPPLLVKASVKPTAGPGAKAALLGTIQAARGMRQVTYAGYPLYFFAGDSAAGQVKGQGIQSKWYVVNASGGLVKKASTTPTTTTAPTTTTGTTTTSTYGNAWG
jgi:predicted lipoprotein with Yx(FWY)xxD motif